MWAGALKASFEFTSAGSALVPFAVLGANSEGLDGYRSLEEGQRVEFHVGAGKKGEEAQNVRVI